MNLLLHRLALRGERAELIGVDRGAARVDEGKQLQRRLRSAFEILTNLGCVRIRRVKTPCREDPMP